MEPEQPLAHYDSLREYLCERLKNVLVSFLKQDHLQMYLIFIFGNVKAGWFTLAVPLGEKTVKFFIWQWQIL